MYRQGDSQGKAGGGKPSGGKPAGKAGKGGKGPGKGYIGRDGKPRRPGLAICRTFARTGECHREGCWFAHAKVPPGLAAIEGVVLEDLGSVMYDAGTGVFTPQNDINVEELCCRVKDELAAIGGLVDTGDGEQGF